MTLNTAITTFNPELLISGDDSQRDNWILGAGSSIFIKSIPDSFDKCYAIKFFASFGTISKVVVESDLTGGRNMIVHFHEWTLSKHITIQKIAKAYPNPAAVFITNHSGEAYFLNCYININKISKDDENEILKERVAILQE